MAKKIEKTKLVKKLKQEVVFPLERENYFILGFGLIIIIIGYFALASGGVEGFMPLVVAPILLVLGYCVIIPIGIFYRKKVKVQDNTETSTEATPK